MIPNAKLAQNQPFTTVLVRIFIHKSLLSLIWAGFSNAKLAQNQPKSQITFHKEWLTA